MARKNFFREAGLTLIEMLLVTAMLSVVGASLFAAFNNGAKIWQKITQEVTAEDINIFFEKMSFDLRNSFPFSAIRFKGENDEVSFPVVAQSGESAESVEEVAYLFDWGKKSLNRRQRTFSEIYQDDQGLEQTLVNHVDSAQFHYYYYDSRQGDYFWTSAWPEENALSDEDKKEGDKKVIVPLAVRIEIKTRDDNQERQFSKTVFLPAGCCRKEVPN